MGDFKDGHIQWKSLESTRVEDQQFLFLIQDSFLPQHVLEPTRGDNVLDIVFSSQKELVDNGKIHTHTVIHAHSANYGVMANSETYSKFATPTMQKLEFLLS